jgi:hypothetical protein
MTLRDMSAIARMLLQPHMHATLRMSSCPLARKRYIGKFTISHSNPSLSTERRLEKRQTAVEISRAARYQATGTVQYKFQGSLRSDLPQPLDPCPSLYRKPRRRSFQAPSILRSLPCKLVFSRNYMQHEQVVGTSMPANESCMPLECRDWWLRSRPTTWMVPTGSVSTSSR